ncbi:TetR/AcrR family transcriptional regulator [Faecalimonas umbilicata]|nr:TetR/AcrR family transcriptional regulator [Faecalimonas umbilicata]
MKRKNQSNILAREYITTALIKLANEKPLSSISISELTQKVGVSRMTYYRNYSSKEEILETYMNEIVAAYRVDLEKMGTPKTYGNYENILHCFRYFKKYQSFLNCIIKIGMGKLLLDALTSYLLETYHKDSTDTALYYSLQAYAGALFNIYMAWTANGYKESIEELASIIQSPTLTSGADK